MDENEMLGELAKAQKGEFEDEVKELDAKDFDKMTERDFITQLHEFISNYLSRPPRSDKGPNL